MTKKLTHNYIRPPHYFNRLITFFVFIGIGLTFLMITLLGHSFSVEMFLLRLVVFVFLLLCLAVIIEYFYVGEYISPHRRIEVMYFVSSLLEDYSKEKDISNYVGKYNYKTKDFLEKKLLGKKNRYVISTIRKVNSHVIVTLLDERRVFAFLFLKFLIKGAVITLEVHLRDGHFHVTRAN